MFSYGWFIPSKYFTIFKPCTLCKIFRPLKSKRVLTIVCHSYEPYLIVIWWHYFFYRLNNWFIVILHLLYCYIGFIFIWWHYFFYRLNNWFIVILHLLYCYIGFIIVNPISCSKNTCNNHNSYYTYK